MEFTPFALKYVAAGIPVLPILPGTKRPAIPKDMGGQGVHDATTDVDQIEAWGQRYPDASIALHLGPVGMLALDFDTKGPDGERGSHPNGLDTLDDWRMSVPEIETAWIQATPTGGFHYIFTAPQGFQLDNVVRIAPGVDIRYNGTFILAAPSPHPEGGFYKWVQRQGDRPPEMPAPIASMLQAAVAQKAGAQTTILEGDDSPIHERHAVLISVGASLRARGFDRATIRAALSSMNERRCQPGPLPEYEIERILDSNFKLEPKFDLVGDVANRLGMKLPDPAEKQKGVRKLKLTTYDRIQESEIDWLMPGYIARGKFTLLWGLEGRGKTFCSLGIAALISNGIPLPGVELTMGTKPGNVLIFSYEDDQSQDIKPRLISCGANMNRIHTMCVEDGSFGHKDVEALAATIDEIPDLAMVVIDPLTEFISGLDENSETVVREAMRPITQLAARKKFALLGVKHANKKEDSAIANRVSGSRAWTALARSVILSGHDNQKENTRHNTYGAIMSTKANNNGLFSPITYEIDHGVFKFGPQDPTITPDRLFPVKVKKPDGR